MKTIKVAIAIIIKANKMLIARRNYGKYQGKWEFVGGKVKTNETSSEALIREVYEEFNLNLDNYQFFTNIKYQYPDFYLDMDCFIVEVNNFDNLKLSVHDCIKWVNINHNISDYDYLDANIELIKKIQLAYHQQS